ncbi:HNH endonuclease [Shinella daejeonensis]|uniref:HNH endonuclease n=1 Tax=Shinella daejeonensis TaxID=659017 RepID=UPI0020C82FD1|nr:HNH endonuclease [Shinella daejeonensis]
MRCIFCKNTSASSLSVEHIVPHSFGNRHAILPKGVVCDSCNNYFARKIEQPLLNDKSFRNLRAWYQVPNKRGKPPSLHGFLAGTELEIGLRVNKEGYTLEAERKRESEEINRIISHREEAGHPIAFLFHRSMTPPAALMSRLLAKMALEPISLRMLHDPVLLENLVDEPHWDRLRRWVRVGDNLEHWPYSMRKVFPEETLMRHPETDGWVQAGYSLDLFITTRRETYLAFIFYGYEFVINSGGPSIKGYEEWLVQQNGNSPLIERLGLRIESRDEDKSSQSYLIGSPNIRAGIEFDLNQGIVGIEKKKM